MISISSPNRISLKEGEALCVEPGGMLAHQNCTMKTSWVAGTFLEKVKLYFLGEESLFRNIYTAQPGGGWIVLEEYLPGQIVAEGLSTDEPALMIRSGAYLASTTNVKFVMKYLGFKGYLEGKGIAAIRASVEEGRGRVYFHAQDGIVKKFDIRPGDRPVIIDNDTILAYSDSLECTLENPGDESSSLFTSGEGWVCKFQGKGLVYVNSGSQKQKDLPVRSAAKTAFRVGFLFSVIAAICYYKGESMFQLTWGILLLDKLL